MQPERRLLLRITRYLKSKGARVIKIWGDEEGFQERGIADLLVCYRGHFIALEVKTPQGEVSRVQELFLISIRRAGGVGEVVTSLDGVKRLIRRLDRT